jgi:hypothetical protein
MKVCHHINSRLVSNCQIPQERVKSSEALKSKLTTSLHKSATSLLESAHQLLRHTPKTFHRFSCLPNELQVRIIELGRGEGAVILATPRYAQNLLKMGWWTPPHPFLSVNYKFRETTLRLRPRAFALHDNAPANNVLAPAQIDFDFSSDLLIVPQEHWLHLGPSETGYQIPDLEKLEYIIISWTRYLWEWNGGMDMIIERLCRMENIKTVALIHQGVLGYGMLRGKKGYVISTEGPFWEGEDFAREVFQARIRTYWVNHPEAAFPNVVSLRLSRTQKPSKGLGVWARHTRDGLVARTYEAIQLW